MARKRSSSAVRIMKLFLFEEYAAKLLKAARDEAVRLEKRRLKANVADNVADLAWLVFFLSLERRKLLNEESMRRLLHIPSRARAQEQGDQHGGGGPRRGAGRLQSALRLLGEKSPEHFLHETCSDSTEVVNR